MNFSVVIAAHNPNIDRFRRVLSAVRAAADTVGDTEIIVVRNGGSPISNEVLALGQPLKLITEDRLGIAWARATGISASRGEYIVFVDDDTVVAEDYLLNALEVARSSSDIGVFGGRIVGDFAHAPSASIRPALAFLAIRDLGPYSKWASAREDLNFDVPGAGMVLTRDVALAFRNMAEDGKLTGIGRAGASLASGDDTVCCLLARRQGLSLGYAPQLNLTHIIPATRLEPAHLRLLVRNIGASAARIQALFYGADRVRVLSRPQLFARLIFHILRNGPVGGSITFEWHLGYREQALRETASEARNTR